MKNCFNFSLTDKQKLRYFANKITPSNWHVYLIEEFDTVDFQHDSVRLNIQLRIRDAFDKPPIENPIYGFVKNIMTYSLNGKVAHVEINLQPPPITWRVMKNLLVHELSHVVEMRWKAFRKKAYRERLSCISIEKEDITDQDLSLKKVMKMRHKIKSFIMAHALMKKRAKKVK